MTTDFGAFKYCMALNVLYTLPERGMKRYENLSRGSVTFLKSLSPNFPKKYHIATTKHLTHPWLYSKIFGVEWINALREQNILAFLEIRDVFGKVSKQFPLDIKRIFADPTADLCLLHLQDETAFKDHHQMNGFTIPVLELQSPQKIVQFGDVVLCGHAKRSADILIPSVIQGKVNVYNLLFKRIFITTERTVDFGMCGGPVIDTHSGKCIGIIEGDLGTTVGEGQLTKTEIALLGEPSKVKGNTMVTDATQLMSLIHFTEDNFNMK